VGEYLRQVLYVSLYGRLPMCKGFLGVTTDRLRLQIYIRPVYADRSLRALMDFADPPLIYPKDSKSEETFRFSGSRSDLSAITRC